MKKQLIKGLISMYISKNIELSASDLENDSDHHVIIEDFIQSEIDKIKGVN